MIAGVGMVTAIARCPNCERSDLEILVSSDAVAEEMALRRKFFAERIDGHLDVAERKDTDDVSHHGAAEIFICRDCEILVRREEDAPSFETDHYERFAMERMLHAHIDAYRGKASIYRPLLPSGARVIEVCRWVLARR